MHIAQQYKPEPECSLAGSLRFISNNANTVTQMSLVKILLRTSHCSSYQHVEHNSSIHDVMVSLADVIICVNVST
jgi:hypothetical protein